MKTRTLLFALLSVLTLPPAVVAGELVVPHQPGDTVTIHVRPDLYAHPSDYWWQKNPSSQGSWDYFTPVDHLHQPIKLERNQTGELSATIPVTNRPLR
ncbi:MAG: hypothetical protein HQL91_13005 [Magnetococcales bacterium]|nr:hypothetical protein [Magnetococcales bacterium]